MSNVNNEDPKVNGSEGNKGSEGTDGNKGTDDKGADGNPAGAEDPGASADSKGKEGDSKGSEGQDGNVNDPKVKDQPPVFEPKLPEGFTLTDDGKKTFEEFRNTQKLSPEQSQAAIDYYLKLEQGKMEGIKKWREGLIAECKADKEIGGDKLDASVREGISFIDTIFNKDESDDFKKFLNESGLGNDKRLIKLLARARKSISEGAILKGGKGGDPIDKGPKRYADGTASLDYSSSMK